MVRIFLVFTYIWQEDFAKIFKVPRAPHNINLAWAITWLVGVIILLYHFKITIHLHLASFYATEKRLAREMFIAQTIKFEFRGLVPLGRICTPATG